MAIEALRKSHQELLRHGAKLRAEAMKFEAAAETLGSLIREHDEEREQSGAGGAGEALQSADAPREADDDGPTSPSTSRPADPPACAGSSVRPTPSAMLRRDVVPKGPPTAPVDPPAPAIYEQDKGIDLGQDTDPRADLAERIKTLLRDHGRCYRVPRVALFLAVTDAQVEEAAQPRYGLEVSRGWVKFHPRGAAT